MSDTGSGTAAPTTERSSDGPANGEPVVRTEGVWKVFGPHGDRLIGTPDAELRLITCGGAFDRVAGSYEENVVVLARLA